MVLDYDTEIEILLFDQDKIVTFKQLTHKFNITPSEAKGLLNKYVNKKDHKSEIYITYLIICEDKEKKKKSINLVNECDLSSLENVNILSKQIYSVQTKQITDFNLLYSNDIDASYNLDRKSNIEVVYREPSNSTNNMDIDNDDDMALIQAEKMTTKTTLTKSNCENIENKKPTTIKEEPKQAATKITLVKEEPKESEIKKPKLNEETNKPAQLTAATKKAEPKKPTKPAQQSTLTSFFKKA